MQKQTNLTNFLISIYLGNCWLYLAACGVYLLQQLLILTSRERERARESARVSERASEPVVWHA